MVERITGLGRRKFLLFLAVYALLCGAIFGVTFLVARDLEATNAELRQAEFDKAQGLLVEKVESYVHGLQGMGGLYITTDFAYDPKAIRTYAIFRDNFRNFPGALGFGFIRVVPKAQRESYLAQRRRVIPEAQINSLGADDFPQHFVIETIEPGVPNHSALWLDVATELTRREAALRAIDTGLPALSGPSQLVQTQVREPGFLFFLPVYRTKVPPFDVEARRRAIEGFAYAPILLDPLLEHLEEYASPRLLLRISDVTTRVAALLYQDRRFAEAQAAGEDVQYENRFTIGGRTWQLEAIFERDGVLHSGATVPLLAGTLLWLVCTALLVLVWRQQAKRQARETYFAKIESLQEAILDAATYSIISTDVDGTIKTFNQAAERLLGYRATEVVGKVTPAIIHRESEVVDYARELSARYQAELVPGFETFIYRARLDGSDTREWSYVRKDGSTFPVRLTTTVLKDSTGAVLGYLGVAEDLTREKELQATVEGQRAVLLSSAKMTALGEMASGVSHEINNPLAIILGMTTMLQMQLAADGKLEPDFAGPLFERIQRTIDRISRIVQGLRNFSREVPLEQRETLPLRLVVDETLNFCSERFRVHGVELRQEIPEELRVHGHLTQLSQVLLNLLNNSFDAVSERPEKWIELRAWTEDGMACLSVTDAGTGIAPAVAEKMMAPFFTTKEVGRGTGLGLSISLGILRAHGGDLAYDPRSAHTQFVLRLPRA